MNITLTGASGFIGNALIGRLKAEGHQLYCLGRNAPKDSAVRFSKWDALGAALPPSEAIAGADAVIHLAGEPVAQRWTNDVKQRIRNSRVNGTQRVVEAIGAAGGQKPKTLIAASAIGYYGNRGEEAIDETARPGKGFLADVCVGWEAAAQAAASLGVRVVNVRIGIALGRDGGALAEMLPIFRMGAGGRIGNGRQWMSWIHLEDLVALFMLALDNDGLHGPMNATSPNPATNGEVSQALADVLHRPAAMSVPEFGLKMLYGEMAQILIDGQRVMPDLALRAGYHFQFPVLREALVSVV